MKRFFLINMVFAVLVIPLSVAVYAVEGNEGETIIPQTICPVMGGEINKEVYVDHEGKRVYFCCPGCIATFKEDPEKYIKKLEDQGITLEKSEK